MFVRIACTFLSVVGGLLGFRWAVAVEPWSTELYVKAITITVFLQVFLISIASKNKDRLARKKSDELSHLRSDLAVTIGHIVCLVFLTLAVIQSFRPVATSLALFCYLNGIAIVLQIESFAASSRQQVVSLDRFWKIQLIGAVVRLVSISILVVFLQFSFHGILVSNILAAAAIAAVYKKFRIFPRSFFSNIRLIRIHYPKLLSLDGFVRSLRLYFEQITLSLAIMGSERFVLEDSSAIQAAYATSGYLNATTVALRQFFAPFELKAFQANLTGQAHVIIGVFCALLSVVIWNLDTFSEFYLLVIPPMDGGGAQTILKSLAVLVFLFPLTLGFAFYDYLPFNVLRKISVILVISPLPLFIALTYMASIWSKTNFPFWAAVTPLTIAFTNLLVSKYNDQ